MFRLKLILLFLILFTARCLLSTVPSVSAKSQMQAFIDNACNESSLGLEAWSGGRCNDSNDPNSGEKTIGAAVSTIGALACNASTCVDSEGNLLGYGATNEAQKYVAYLITNPPVKTGEYVADLLHNSGFITQPAYAQGIGFSALSPTLWIWKAFRNLAYFLFIIIFIVVGIMIMFRAQLNPQTVVTVQAALPKIIITLIMITFSYAIAGFVVDMIYLAFFVITNLFAAFGIVSDPALARDTLFGYSVFRIGWSYFISPVEFAGDVSKSVGHLLTNAVGLGWLQGIGSALAYLIIAVAVLIALFRTLFALIISWISIILAVVFAPMILLLNAVPGVNTFSNWIKSLLANALVFPAVGILILVGVALVGGTTATNMGVTPNPTLPDQSGIPGTGWVPPLVATNTGDMGSNMIVGILGLGIIMLLPEVAKLVKEAFQVKDQGIGQAVQANLQRGLAPWQKGAHTGINSGIGYLDYRWSPVAGQGGTSGFSKARYSIFRALSGFGRT